MIQAFCTTVLFLFILLIGMKGAQTPAGPAGQARPRRRFSAEEARRPPRGKQSAWNGKQQFPSTNKLKKTADDSIFKQIWLYGCPNFVHPVDWNGRRADSGGICGTGETPQAL
ncbi:Ribose 5-phosphate isomerase B [Bacillus badius]|nr:Ribose 5-phosphate isomerase B [Bacillus badius]